MYKNPFSFKYARRSNEIDTQEKSNMFSQKDINDIQVLTYDSLIRNFKLNKRYPRNLVSKVKNGYEIQHIHSYTSAFAYLKPGNLFFDKIVRAKLIDEGYDIEAWEKGTLLNFNGTQPLKRFGKVKTDKTYMTEETED